MSFIDDRIAYLTKRLASVRDSKKPALQKALDALGALSSKKPSKRAHDADGHFATDDKSTPNVNEAWVGGKAPTKKKGK